MWEKKSVRDGCNTDGYLEKLESIQEQLELCKKSLADFLDGRRRQFPRYYFVSEADLLDILSNGSDPNKILVHTPKVRAGLRERWGQAMLLQSAGFKNAMAFCLSPLSPRCSSVLHSYCLFPHCVRHPVAGLPLLQDLGLGRRAHAIWQVRGWICGRFLMKWTCYGIVLGPTRSLGLPTAAGGRTLPWAES